jgi:predicted DNA-binding ribbon-helix-helix protein
VLHPPGRYDLRIAMQDTAIRKRSVMIAGHATSVSLEPEFWDELRALATVRGLSLNALIAEIDAGPRPALRAPARQPRLSRRMRMRPDARQRSGARRAARR